MTATPSAAPTPDVTLSLTQAVRAKLPALASKYAAAERQKTRRSPPPLPIDGVSDAQALLHHAQLSCYFDEIEPAERSFRAAVEHDGGYGAILGLAMFLLGRGDYAGAADAFCQAHVMASGTDAFPLLFHGTALRLLRKENGQHKLADRKCPRSADDLEAERRNMTCTHLRDVAAVFEGSSDMPDVCEHFLGIEDRVQALCSEPSPPDGVPTYHRVLHDVLPRELVDRVLQPYYAALFARAAELTRSGELGRAGPAGLELGLAFLHTGGVGTRTFVRLHEETKRQELWVEPIAEALNHALVGLSECYMSRPMLPTYPWPVSYAQDGAQIEPHTDRPENEVSLTYQLAITPAHAAWPLKYARADHLENGPLQPGEPSRPEVWASLENPTTISLHDNDGIVYHGRDMVHWRDPKPADVDGIQQLIFSWRAPQSRTCLGSALGRQAEPLRALHFGRKP
jgi:hypothetical protein